MVTGREVTAPKPERARRDVAGLVAPVVVEVTLEQAAEKERVVEVVLIAASEDGDRPL